MILTDDILLEKVETFIKQHKMAPTRFGLEAMEDGALVKQLQSGRSLTLKNAERVIRFMDEYAATHPDPNKEAA